MQLYTLWKNLSIGMLVFVVLIGCTRLLPFYFGPVLALAGALALYTIIFRQRAQKAHFCVMTLYAFFYCILVYCVVSVTMNVLYAWGLIVVPDELVYFNEPYLVSLMLVPISFLTMLVIYFRRNHLAICAQCRFLHGDRLERGTTGLLLDRETKMQLQTLTAVLGVLSVVIWTYFLCEYVNINQNGRDWYVFAWLVLITFLLVELYFVVRYVNLYLDLKETNELITPSELNDMTARTYVRLYAVAGNKVFVDDRSIDRLSGDREVIDTPFQTKRAVNGMTGLEVQRLAERTVGAPGKLRFFFGRRHPEQPRLSLLRYFYFLDSEAPQPLGAPGKWMDFSELKNIYRNRPSEMSSRLVSDITRLATIMVTSKKFDETGRRKNALKSYQPSFDLIEVRDSDIDFEDNKWIAVSRFNSDTPFFALKNRWKRLIGKPAYRPEGGKSLHND